MGDGNNEDDEFTELSLPPELPDSVKPEPLSYAPWHKPRKQWVRAFQWREETDGLLVSLNENGFLPPDNRLRYLTIPGPDLLDVHVIKDACASSELMLRYTGYCQVKESEERRLRRNIQLFQNVAGSIIDPSSEVSQHRFEEISKSSSTARLLLEKNGPYHVVNVDACQPLANGEPAKAGRIVDAIRSVAQYQFNKIRHPWLMFVTTVTQPDSVSKSSLDGLHQSIKSNAAKDQLFAEGVLSLFDCPKAAIDASLTAAASKSGLRFAQMFSLGLSKWLMHLAEQANFEVVKKSACCYSTFRREPFEPNMVSLCYEFRPNDYQIVDSTGLTNNPGLGSTVSGDPVHMHLLDKTREMINLRYETSC